jgi:hypothetical protein
VAKPGMIGAVTPRGFDDEDAIRRSLVLPSMGACGADQATAPGWPMVALSMGGKALGSINCATGSIAADGLENSL